MASGRSGAEEGEELGGAFPAGDFVIAVVDNRAHEVGVCAFSKTSPEAFLTQFIDGRAFAYTQTLFNLYQPSEVLIISHAPKGGSQRGKGTGLAEAVSLHAPEIPGCAVVSLPRSHFDDERGHQLLKDYCIDDAALKEASMKKQYLGFAAADAVIGHMERAYGSIFTKRSISVQLINNTGRVQLMDVETVAALELIDPIGGGRSKHHGRASVFSLLKAHVKTRGGAQVLKASLLQPMTDVVTIDARLDLLQEILEDKDLHHSITAVLKAPPLKDIGGILNGICLQSRDESYTQAKLARIVAATIKLQEMLGVVPRLAEALSTCQSDLAKYMFTLASVPELAALADVLSHVLDPDVQTAKQSFINKTQQCFAVRTGVDDLLDLCRQSFADNTEAVHECLHSIQEENDLPSIKLLYNQRRGFFLSVPMADLENRPLPEDFIQWEKKGKSMTCSTAEIESLNRRLSEAESECLKITTDLLSDNCVHAAVGQMGILQALSEAVHILDMVTGFASFVSSSPRDAPFVRPTFAETGPIAIVEGRHVLLDQLLHDGAGGGGGGGEAGRQVPNSVFLNDCTNFALVTGPNMAGKSTLLKQVALVVILGQAGCYVPAALASIRPVDRIMTRMGHDDSLKANSSSFLKEMEDIAYIVCSATSRSLVLIDELGRSTSTADGLGIAWAVSEYFIALGNPTLFASHMWPLKGLAALYPNCTHQCMQMEFTFRLGNEPAYVPHYGLSLARSVGIPPEVLTDGWRIAEKVDERAARAEVPTGGAGGAPRAAYEAVSKLHCLRHSGLGDAEMREEIRALQEGLTQQPGG